MAVKFIRSKNFMNDSNDEFARTVIFNTRNLDDLVEDAAGGNSVEKAELKASAAKITDSAKKFLVQGDVVDIEGLGKFSLRAKGSLAPGERFDRNKQRLDLNFTPDTELMEYLIQNAEVEQIDQNLKPPHIKKMLTGPNKENIVRRFYSNHITGVNLKQNKQTLTGIKLIKEDDHNQFIEIPISQIDIDSHTAKEIIFAFHNSLTLPAWLVHNQPIDIALLYTSEEGNKVRSTDFHITKFVING